MQTTGEKRKLVVEVLFDIIQKQKINYFYELKDMNFKEFSTFVKDAKGIDDSSKKLILDMLKALLFGEVKKV